MQTLLIIRQYDRARCATTAGQLRNAVGSDCWFDWCELYKKVSAQGPDVLVDEANADWPTFATLIEDAGELVAEYNRRLQSVEWRDQQAVHSVLQEMDNEFQAQGMRSARLGAARYIARVIESYAAFGPDYSEIKSARLFGVITIAEMRPLDTAAYDVFISYKTRRYAAAAEKLAQRLVDAGYCPWFDKRVLTRKNGYPEWFETEYLLSVLKNGISHSRCVLIFEAAARALVLPPGRTEAQALKDRTAMHGPDGALVAWDWQLQEIEAAERGLAIHPSFVVVFDKPSGKPDRVIEYQGDEQLWGAVLAALSFVGTAPDKISAV